MNRVFKRIPSGATVGCTHSVHSCSLNTFICKRKTIHIIRRTVVYKHG